MSLLSRILFSIGVFFLNLVIIFNLPTADKSYLSELKNKFLNNVSAVSIVGGSPGLNILKISNNASYLDLALSSCIVLLIQDPISILSTFNKSILLIFLSFMKSMKSSSISNPAS